MNVNNIRANTRSFLEDCLVVTMDSLPSTTNSNNTVSAVIETDQTPGVSEDTKKSPTNQTPTSKTRERRTMENESNGV
jgi:hypothetical protein